MGRRRWMDCTALAILLAPCSAVAAQPSPAFNWSGFYVGVTAGGGSYSQRVEDAGSAFVFDGTTRTFRSDDAVLGGYAGYNLQLSSIFLIGIESDLTYNFGRPGGSFPSASLGAPVIQSDGLLQWTLRGRLGVTFDRTLLYFTGGLAIANPQTRNLYSDGSPGQFALAGQRYGYVIGGGAEYAVSRNWLVRIEGLFSDFGTQTVIPSGFTGKTIRIKSTQSQIRGGLTYKF
jgi:outer membrane immunogenic protein